MCWVLASLVDKRGKLLVPGIYDDVAPVTDEEKKLYEKIDFDLEEYTKDVGAHRLLHDTKVHPLLSHCSETQGLPAQLFSYH